MLKLYVYGYLHQVTSSRKLEREAGRNIELMWLIGKLAPDFKTIADFRHDNASAIQIACQRFVAICRALGLVGGGMVAIDGSRLRAVNTHEKNYTKGKLARRKAHVEESIARYLAELEEADSAETGPATPRIEHLTERLASLRGRLGELEEIGRQLEASPDQQVSLTDPDTRAMATGSDHRGVVGYNVQAAVDTEHHIVVADAVTNRGHDRSHLLEMAKAAQAEIGAVEMIALADRGYYEGEQIRSCAEAGIIPMVPKPNTSPAQARGFWDKTMFLHEPETDTYRCPAGAQLQKRFARVEGGKLIGVYFNQKACTVPAYPVRCARPARRSASGDGSTKRCSMPWSAGFKRGPKPWRSAAARSSTSSAPSRAGWALPTSEREASRMSPPKPAWRSWPTTSSAPSPLPALPRPSTR